MFPGSNNKCEITVYVVKEFTNFTKRISRRMVSKHLEKSTKQTNVRFLFLSLPLIISHSSDAADKVDRFFLKPNWKMGSKSLFSANKVILLVRMDCINFKNGFSRTIERKLFGSCLLPFLCIKKTLDSRNVVGKAHAERE